VRAVRFSKTAIDQFNALLAQGRQRFSARIVAKSRDQVYRTIERHISLYPGGKSKDPNLGLHIYPISKTPFVVIYDFDEAELRVYFIVLAGFEASNLDAKSAEW
jgi:mRNA-degrading endonuclease RelE of RelBE toxin-antitoxin system